MKEKIKKALFNLFMWGLAILFIYSIIWSITTKERNCVPDPQYDNNCGD